MSTARAAALAMALPGALLLGCRRTPAPAESEQAVAMRPPPAAAAPAATPIDHLAPDELLEGPSRAFGVPLPRVLEVQGAFPEVTFASGRAPVHALVRYFAARLVGGALRESPEAATFDHVQARAGDAASGTGPELRIRIGTSMGRSVVEIRDATPPPAIPGLDEPSRWRRVGLTQDGRLADPHHLD